MPFRRKMKRLQGRGVILFEKVEEALHAEKVLKKAGYSCKLVAPPPALRKGCDLALEIDLVERLGIERLLAENNVNHVGLRVLKGEASEVLDIVKATDFGDAVMVKAGNMKLTFEKASGRILNVSGGGCPDIPYLHAQLVTKRLNGAPRPRDIGFTLCGLMLDRALEGCLELWRKQEKEERCC